MRNKKRSIRELACYNAVFAAFAWGIKNTRASVCNHIRAKNRIFENRIPCKAVELYLHNTIRIILVLLIAVDPYLDYRLAMLSVDT